WSTVARPCRRGRIPACYASVTEASTDKSRTRLALRISPGTRGRGEQKWAGHCLGGPAVRSVEPIARRRDAATAGLTGSVFGLRERKGSVRSTGGGPKSRFRPYPAAQFHSVFTMASTAHFGAPSPLPAS